MVEGGRLKRILSGGGTVLLVAAVVALCGAAFWATAGIRGAWLGLPATPIVLSMSLAYLAVMGVAVVVSIRQSRRDRPDTHAYATIDAVRWPVLRGLVDLGPPTIVLLIFLPKAVELVVREDWTKAAVAGAFTLAVGLVTVRQVARVVAAIAGRLGAKIAGPETSPG
ncbi:MAG: hypothetical protein V4466_14085 [Pseudomonadota bacterium]